MTSRIRTLAAAGFAVTGYQGGLRVQGVADPARITRTLTEHGIYLSELSPIAADLESVFLELTQGQP